MSPSTLPDRIRELEAALAATETRAAKAEDIVARCDLLNEDLCFQIKRMEAELQAGSIELKRLRDHAKTMIAENRVLRARVKELGKCLQERPAQRPPLAESTFQSSNAFPIDAE